MYPFLKQKISKPLYLLYRNLRDSIYRGPVDFITGQARNTLAQDSQLRTQICDREVSLKNFYITVKIDPASEEVTKVKVISCDTISQVKHKIILKIYGPTLSYRPRLEDFALFYLGLEEEAANSENTNSAAKRPKYPIELLDRDPSSFIDKSGYRKINTLSHYKINLDGSKFAIVNKNTANLRYDSLVQASNLNQNNLSLYGNSSNNTMTRNMSLGMKFFNKNSVKSQNNSMNLESQGQHPGNAASFTMPPPPIFPPAQDTQNSLTRKSLQKNYSEGQTQLYSENFSPAANPSNLHSGQANKTSTSLLSKISNLVLPLTDKEEQENNPNYVESKSLLNNTSHIGLDHSNTSHSHNFTHSYQNSGNLMNLAATMPRNYPLNSYGYHQSQQTHQQPHHQHIKNQKSNISINKSSAFLNLEGQSNPEYDQVTNSTPNGKPSYEPLPKHNNFDQAQNLSQGHPNNNSL